MHAWWLLYYETHLIVGPSSFGVAPGAAHPVPPAVLVVEDLEPGKRAAEGRPRPADEPAGLTARVKVDDRRLNVRRLRGVVFLVVYVAVPRLPRGRLHELRTPRRPLRQLVLILVGDGQPNGDKDVLEPRDRIHLRHRLEVVVEARRRPGEVDPPRGDHVRLDPRVQAAVRWRAAAPPPPSSKRFVWSTFSEGGYRDEALEYGTLVDLDEPVKP